MGTPYKSALEDEFLSDVIGGWAELRGCGLLTAAVAMRRDSSWTKVPINQRLRGLVVAYNTHDDDYGFEHCNEVSGEINWR